MRVNAFLPPAAAPSKGAAGLTEAKVFFDFTRSSDYQ
jgi:hypothetical protein